MYLADYLVCPDCKSKLTYHKKSLTCKSCKRIFPVDDGIPILLPNEIEIIRNSEKINDIASKYSSYGVETEYSFSKLINGKRPYYLHFSNFLDENNSLFRGRVLEIGANVGGTSTILRTKCKNCEIFASDISIDFLKFARKLSESGKIADYIVCSMDYLPFPNNFFDCVFGSSVLSHCADYSLLGREISRVLRKGGAYLGINEVAVSNLMKPVYSELAMYNKYLRKFGISKKVLDVKTYNKIFSSDNGFKKLDIVFCRDSAYYCSIDTPIRREYYTLISHFPKFLIQILGGQVHIVAKT